MKKYLKSMAAAFGIFAILGLDSQVLDSNDFPDTVHDVVFQRNAFYSGT
ncbi:hypothetical protein G3A_12290 [Bacillus sp. 17376]|nr:hypothetical protein G3A_12290 [Bacillus sp. 17376]